MFDAVSHRFVARFLRLTWFNPIMSQSKRSLFEPELWTPESSARAVERLRVAKRKRSCIDKHAVIMHHYCLPQTAIQFSFHEHQEDLFLALYEVMRVQEKLYIGRCSNP